MKISEYYFSKDEIEMLKKYRDLQKEMRLKIRFIALLLLANRNPVEEVATAIGVCAKTVINWYKLYREKGIDSMNSYNYKPKKAYLSYHQICQVIIWVTWANPENILEIL